MEHWNRAYREAPQIFDAFTRAEDPDGRIVRTLVEQAGLEHSSVLEIGCGTGRYTAELMSGTARYVALERSPNMLHLACMRFRNSAPAPEFLCACAEQIPLRSGSIDRVLAGWVLINMRPDSRRRALSEIERVLRQRDASVWLIENHWSGEFQQLRGRRSDEERARIRRLIDSAGFEIVDVVETELRFPSSDDCREVLGYLCGNAVRDRLRRRPASSLTHNVVILRRGAPA